MNLTIIAGTIATILVVYFGIVVTWKYILMAYFATVDKLICYIREKRVER